jgi:hypothetical protein
MAKLSFFFSVLVALIVGVAGIVEGARKNADAVYAVPFVVFSSAVAWWNFKRMKEEDAEERREMRELYDAKERERR